MNFIRGRMAGKTRHITRTALRGRLPKEMKGDWNIGDFAIFTDPVSGYEAMGRVMKFNRTPQGLMVDVSVMAINDHGWQKVKGMKGGLDRIHEFTPVPMNDLLEITYREYLDMLEEDYPKYASVRKAFTEDEATEVGEAIGIDWDAVDFDPKDLADGMKIELEHGTKVDERVNITDDDLEMTAQIAWAHLMEDPDYYILLDDMEKEFDGERTPELRKEAVSRPESNYGIHYAVQLALEHVYKLPTAKREALMKEVVCLGARTHYSMEPDFYELRDVVEEVAAQLDYTTKDENKLGDALLFALHDKWQSVCYRLKDFMQE